MTDKQTITDPIAHAARLLREAAEELRQAHAYNNSEGWENETDAKTAYDEHMAAAQALEDWVAAVGAGGVQALSAAPAGWDELRDTLVAVSAAIAEQDDRAAQKMIREILAASPAPPAEQQTQPGAVYAELPQPDSWFHFTPQYWVNKLRDFANRTHALRMEQAAPKAAPGGQNTVPAEWLEQAYREGWAACRDAETIGEEAEDWAFGNSTANSQMIDAQQAAPQQEAQEPCQTCTSLARTVMLDQVSFDRKPDCYGIRQVTDDEGVEEWEDIRTSPDVAREEANDMMATGRGEIYEVVPLWTTPQPAPAPLIARSLAEWHEDDGCVAWWAWNGREWAGEPAWIGNPNCEDWPGYHTHWTPHPDQPVFSALAAQGGH